MSSQTEKDPPSNRVTDPEDTAFQNRILPPLMATTTQLPVPVPHYLPTSSARGSTPSRYLPPINTHLNSFIPPSTHDHGNPQPYSRDPTLRYPQPVHEHHRQLLPGVNQDSHRDRVRVAPISDILHHEPSSHATESRPQASPRRLEPQAEGRSSSQHVPPIIDSRRGHASVNVHTPFYDPAREDTSSNSTYSTRQIHFSEQQVPSIRSSHHIPNPQGHYRQALPSPPPRQAPSDNRYHLVLRQQPHAARACGYGEKDRRPVDPPPVVQLKLQDWNPDSVEDENILKSPMNVMHCSLWTVPEKPSSTVVSRDVTTEVEPHMDGRLSRRLMGTLVSTSFFAEDPALPKTIPKSARFGSFFVFHDLSCRKSGIYKLRFQLTVIDSRAIMTGGASAPIMATIDSKPFEVYSAKEFVGMEESTSLIKALKEQGLGVPIKKGSAGRMKKGGGKRGSTVSNGSDDEDEKDVGRKKTRP